MKQFTFNTENFQLTEKQEKLISKIKKQQKNSDQAFDYYSSFMQDPYDYSKKTSYVDDLEKEVYFFESNFKDEESAYTPTKCIDDALVTIENFEDLAIEEAISYFTYSY